MKKVDGVVYVRAADVLTGTDIRKNRGSLLKTQKEYWLSIGLSKTRGSELENEHEAMPYRLKLAVWQNYFASFKERERLIELMRS